MSKRWFKDEFDERPKRDAIARKNAIAKISSIIAVNNAFEEDGVLTKEQMDEAAIIRIKEAIREL